MINTSNAFKLAILFAAVSVLALITSVSTTNRPLVAAPAGIAASSPRGNPPDASSLSPDVLIIPEDLAKILPSPKGDKPLIIHVGFHVLYSQGHIPGSEYIGPASQQEMVEKLRKRVESLPRGKFIVLYCGCCPWTNCPTVKPAYEALHSMGFTKLKVLYIANNFGRDWIYKGYPVEQGQ
ncbi:MAG: rhodanese-like domain-containing protein [Terriglobia bacterium]